MMMYGTDRQHSLLVVGDGESTSLIVSLSDKLLECGKKPSAILNISSHLNKKVDVNLCEKGLQITYFEPLEKGKRDRLTFTFLFEGE